MTPEQKQILKQITNAAASAMGDTGVIILMAAQNVRTREAFTSEHYVVYVGTPLEARGLLAVGTEVLEKLLHGTHQHSDAPAVTAPLAEPMPARAPDGHAGRDTAAVAAPTPTAVDSTMTADPSVAL